ncbi:hypothetical protein [Oleiharenicola sp. Vm1]|uniref:hypothetical protein n=1 Tax=Oleiharenicola sp. Vm1 TaxID=3398393 RepID=UPI0039F4948E
MGSECRRALCSAGASHFLKVCCRHEAAVIPSPETRSDQLRPSHHARKISALAHASPSPPLGLALLALTGAASARADVSLPHLFSDHMVMQCDAAVPVWGWAAPGERVRVAFAGQTKETTADRAGQWSLKLDPLAAGTRGTLTVQAANQRLIEDVLVGEVWLAAGQSNMQLRIDEAAEAAEAVATADLPQVRMFTVARRAAESAATDCDGQWIVCQPDTVGKFSAAGFYFARELHARRAVPVGVINSSWGATRSRRGRVRPPWPAGRSSLPFSPSGATRTARRKAATSSRCSARRTTPATCSTA